MEFEEGVDYPMQDFVWEDAECSDEASCAARDAFGIKYLYPWQQIVISNILDASRGQSVFCPELGGEDSSPTDTCTVKDSALEMSPHFHQIVLLPTGAGKSLCFLTPALLLDGPTLVLYPLLALMADQKRRMDQGGLKSVVFKGGQSDEEREENFKLLSQGAKIILANPEVLQNEKLVQRLKKFGIKHIAIDEAHCVSEWGDSFRPAYLTLGDIIKKLDVPVVTAFTATASPKVLERVSEVLFDGQAHIVRSDSDRPNIHYSVANCYAKKRAAFFLACTMPKPLLIFCGTRAKSESMARELAAYLPPDTVRFYHAGMEKEERTQTEKWFYDKTDAVLCSTCAFGMGVDKKNIHTVLHYQSSPNAESYLQEAGRAARDGSIGNAVLLWSHEDSVRVKQYPLQSRERVMGLFAEAGSCRRQVLLDALGGEEAYCDGCDVCRRGGPAPFAYDALVVLDFVSKRPRYSTRPELERQLVEEFNALGRDEIGMSVWDTGDVREITEQLFAQGMLRICRFPWARKVELTKKGREIISSYRPPERRKIRPLEMSLL